LTFIIIKKKRLRKNVAYIYTCEGADPGYKV
jgi:hypothetical protein